MSEDRWESLDKDQQQEVTELLEKLDTNLWELRLTIHSIADLVKDVEMIVALLGEGLPDAIKKIISTRELLRLGNVRGQVNFCRRSADFLKRQIPESISIIRLPFLPSDQALDWLDEADEGLKKTADVLQEAEKQFKDIPTKVRPVMGQKSGRTKHKWENFKDKEHHVDLAAAYLEQLVRVNRLSTAKNGARLLYALEYRCKDPWREPGEAESNFREIAKDGQKFLRFLDL